MEVINKLYISAVSHPGGTKQGRGESSAKFVSKPLEDLTWRGSLRRVFQHLQHVNCSCDQRDFPSPDASIRHIERSHPKGKDSVTYCALTTLDLKVYNNRERTVAAQGKTRDFRISEFGLRTQDFRCQLTAFYDPGSTYIAALLRRSEYGQRGKRI